MSDSFGLLGAPIMNNKGFLRFLKIFCVMLIIPAMISCSTMVPLAKSKKYSFLKGGIRVVKDKIYCDDTMFAELKYFQGSFEDGEQGLAIYYYPPYDREEWIYPDKGWSVVRGRIANSESDQERVVYTRIEDMNRILNKDHEDIEALIKGKIEKREYWANAYLNKGHTTKFTSIKAVSRVVNISSDGKYVYYKTQGLFGMSWFTHKYSIEYGE